VPVRRTSPGLTGNRFAARAILITVLALLGIRPALAQPARAAAPPAPPGPAAEIERAAQSTDIPAISPSVSLGDLQGKPLTRVEIVTLGDRWASPVRVTRARAGDPLTAETSRAAMREILDTGRFARASAEAIPDGPGARLRIFVLPRRIIATIQLSGGALDTEDTLEAAAVAPGGEITSLSLAEIASSIRAYYAARGFAKASVYVDTNDTDTPEKVVLTILITPGPPRTIARRIFVIDPRADREVGSLKQRYALATGDRASEPALADADRDLTEILQQSGFHRAEVNHAVRDQGPETNLYVYVTPGPRLVPAFDGNRVFDSDELTAALALDAAADTKPSELVERLRTFYIARGFLDTEIRVTEQGAAGDPVHYLVFTIRENDQVRVVKRIFPCLTGVMSPDQVGQEIESFLTEELPTGVSVGDPNLVSSIFGPTQFASELPRAREWNPLTVYAPDTYDRAIEHLRDLFHSRGYLNAVVGPVSIVRGTCGKGSTTGRCIPEPPKETVRARCDKDALGLPLPEPPLPEALSCRPDAKGRVACAPEITLRIPIHLGPQTTLYDLSFEGNKTFPDKRLAEIAELKLGGALSNVEIEAARLRILDEYKNLGFAYAEVRASIEPSPDRTRARARFVVIEREAVIIRDFKVQGNTKTNKDRILSRLLLRKDGAYRQDFARLSEERIATLGTFASVAISLEDPEVPQKDKRVIVTVVEQPSQYLDPRIGFSTGEGFRFAFEYGHKNIAGEAVALTLRVQLSYLFDFIILDPAVRENYGTLSALDRLERRNTASLAFPEIGLGPLVNLSVDGVDARDNQRDFGLTKQAFIPTLTYRPIRAITTQLSASSELNDVGIFACGQDEGCGSIEKILGPLNVPYGRTLAIAQRASFSWDGRDNPFAATKGVLIATGVEHVTAFPSEVSNNPADIRSHFLRFTGRVAGYIRLSESGTALAMSISTGYNLQLNDESQTYPDRLFFLGGVDSLRAFLADSVIPEDDAQRILKRAIVAATGKRITPEDIVIRGGDLSLNPRFELRVPMNDTFHAGFFFDTGNLWRDPANINLFALRYAAGAGLRITTPIGPLALDYGINLKRRSWEDFGAFHFSIGLF
jgi:outer membrane protein assembly factor BamA